MTHALDRRLTRLEDEQPQESRPYAIMPERCKTMEEWLIQTEQQTAGKGHYELLPLRPGAYVRLQRWVHNP
jgi:hypothetical protein